MYMKQFTKRNFLSFQRDFKKQVKNVLSKNITDKRNIWRSTLQELLFQKM